ncbi:hypothetical protein DCAR_0418269 [Daucus carota subsp. sativus]|uniref:Uncharacterized protein n=1 Tax=Daucus carota subsp. sativus TaxID=79200 RepID=A0A165ZA17_DAUCS|nr:PREDICTED: uncharacterized protein At2g39795, mitochondrial-like [Daucus carota subsp. sativus]WOG98923.1 hypothetical protein DCAR_0418269 [Daucus carota subsp. sativus]
MQKSEAEDLIYSVKSLRAEFELLRGEISLLSEVVRGIQKCNSGGSYVSSYESDSDEIFARSQDNEVADKMSEERVICQDNKADEKTSDLSGERVISQDNSDLSEERVISQENKALSEEIWRSDNRGNDEKIAAEKMNDLSRDEGYNDKASEKMSDFSEALATDNAEIQKSENEERNNERVPDGKEQDQLRKEIESEISRVLDFCRLSCQGRCFPADFPLEVYYDHPGVDSVTLYRENKSEKIYVTASRPSIFTPVTAKNYAYHKSFSFKMQLHVAIWPVIADGRGIAFKCFAFSTGFLIEEVYASAHDSRGLNFSDLNGGLQTEFKKYLEMKGITTSTTNTIFGYMLDKVNREKLITLNKLRELGEA